MMLAVKYTFWAGSIKGLSHNVEVVAHNYRGAKNKVLKYMFTNKLSEHLSKEHQENSNVISIDN